MIDFLCEVGRKISKSENFLFSKKPNDRDVLNELAPPKAKIIEHYLGHLKLVTQKTKAKLRHLGYRKLAPPKAHSGGGFYMLRQISGNLNTDPPHRLR